MMVKIDKLEKEKIEETCEKLIELYDEMFQLDKSLRRIVLMKYNPEYYDEEKYKLMDYIENLINKLNEVYKYLFDKSYFVK